MRRPTLYGKQEAVDASAVSQSCIDWDAAIARHTNQQPNSIVTIRASALTALTTAAALTSTSPAFSLTLLLHHSRGSDYLLG